MRILLDIDGVMVSGASWRPVELLEDGFAKFLPKAVEGLNALLSNGDCTVVLSTSHKHRFSKEAWLKAFEIRGIKLKTLETLDRNDDYLSRKDEILRWVESNPFTDFIILDDDKGLNDLPNHIKERFVLTNSTVGLNREKTEEALELMELEIA